MKLSEVASISSGLASVKRYQPENKILESWPILRSIHNGSIETGEISLALPERIAERITIRPGDLLITTKFNGRCPIYRVSESDQDDIIASQMVLIIRSGNSLLTEMLHAFLDSAEGQNRLNAVAQDIQFSSPSRSPLKNLTVTGLNALDIPDRSHWSRIVEEWQRLQAAIARFERICQQL